MATFESLGGNTLLLVWVNLHLMRVDPQWNPETYVLG